MHVCAILLLCNFKWNKGFEAKNTTLKLLKIVFRANKIVFSKLVEFWTIAFLEEKFFLTSSVSVKACLKHYTVPNNANLLTSCWMVNLNYVKSSKISYVHSFLNLPSEKIN